ncbi:Phage-related tail protein [Collimonas arenae]|uniref:Phage-related tail protein n=1 Tax=Collimonas arenae TaxID=279058 RepID=A0A0A1FJC0_9BURK|nr:phage tail protein [Collimonas arenae]AIY43002.1 Phage-related tail protein [Collimonas arenae]
MMMALGMFVFSLPTLAYQELHRQTEWKHASTSRVGARDAHQFTGKGDDTVTLSGWIAPELTGSVYSLDALRLMADTGKSWILILGTGRILGSFIITNMTEGRTHLAQDGDAGRIEFTIALKRTDESVLGLLNTLGDLGSIKNMLSLEGIGNSVNNAINTGRSTLNNVTNSVRSLF